MNTQTADFATRLERFAPFLRLQARRYLDRRLPRLQRKFDAADVVQLTLLEACRCLSQFRGETDAQLAAWLDQALVNRLRKEIRYYNQQKRDIRRESDLQDALDLSSARLDAVELADSGSTPSERAWRGEQALLLAEALERLPEPQRDAVELRHLEGWSVADIARYQDRTTAAVAGLLHRGLEQLRGLLSDCLSDEPE
jgi:RNA polymerase sigma-70 factor (ECF subfamily)